MIIRVLSFRNQTKYYVCSEYMYEYVYVHIAHRRKVLSECKLGTSEGALKCCFGAKVDEESELLTKFYPTDS